MKYKEINYYNTNGDLHRKDGPAFIYESKELYIWEYFNNGKEISPDDNIPKYVEWNKNLRTPKWIEWNPRDDYEDIEYRVRELNASLNNIRSHLNTIEFLFTNSYGIEKPFKVQTRLNSNNIEFINTFDYPYSILRFNKDSREITEIYSDDAGIDTIENSHSIPEALELLNTSEEAMNNRIQEFFKFQKDLDIYLKKCIKEYFDVEV